MYDLTNTIETTKSNLAFHRRMVKFYFILLVLVVGGYASIEVMSEIRNYELTSRLASLLRNAPSRIEINVTGAAKYLIPSDTTLEISPDAVKDFTNAKISISLPLLTVTILLIVAIYGLLRHHLRRINLAEDRIFFLERLVPIITNGAFDKDILDIWVGKGKETSESFAITQSQDEPPLHPGYEILEKSIDMLSDIKKSVGTRFKS